MTEVVTFRENIVRNKDKEKQNGWPSKGGENRIISLHGKQPYIAFPDAK
jgi:hypothetical protein